MKRATKLLSLGFVVFTVVSLVMLVSFVGCKAAPAAETEETTAVETTAAETKAAETTEAPEAEATGELVFYHYWSSGSWLEGINKVLDMFEQKYPNIKLHRSPLEHEAFKTSIGVSLAGGNPPDAFSYWCGARTQFFVDKDLLYDLTSLWEEKGFDSLFPAETKAAASTYNGKIYAVPVSQFPVMMWYNKHIFDDLGITPPTTWEEFLSVCETLKKNGITPISLGSKFRWPAQYWFDYLLTRSAGAEFRQRLMAGEESYTDPKVMRAFELWKELLDKGYFISDPAAYDWAEALQQMVNKEAAMNLMGGWASGSLILDMGQEPGVDYDFFEFPIIDPSVEKVVVGTYDGIVMSKDAANPENAKLFMEFVASAEAQSAFAQTVGCIAPNITVSQDIYNVIDKKEIEAIKGIQFLHGYDLATTPPVADIGLNTFAKFLDNPANYKAILEEAQTDAQKAFQEAQ